EAGLLGSMYYVDHPVFPLQKIKFVLNLDLVTTGEKGMTVVNAFNYPKLFDTLLYVNKTMEYLPVINPRQNTHNSDHYSFTQKNVPAFFFYLMGDYPYYHDVDDTFDKIKLLKYEDSFRLIRRFADLLM
ncbi:MAG: M28 family peptidase, partial [Bacteroidetes bacterium]|nr:M28 family peptidase [Bacteroidota bacterium]